MGLDIIKLKDGRWLPYVNDVVNLDTFECPEHARIEGVLYESWYHGKGSLISSLNEKLEIWETIVRIKKERGLKV